MNYTFLSKPALRFRRFTHKAYAAFCSIHRHVTIGRLSRAICDRELLKSGGALVCCLLMSGNGIALADDTSDPLANAMPPDSLLLSLQEVQVISHQTEVHQRACRLVSSLSCEDMQAVPALTVADYLAYVPGLDVRTRGANGSQTDVSMRGGTFDQVQLLLNGVSLSDAQTGHYQFNLPLSADLIERIELLQGGSVGLSGAFAGAVNIVTRQTDSMQHAIRFTAGYNQLLSPEWAGLGRVGNWHWAASASYTRNEGYYAPDPSEKEKTALANSGHQSANLFFRATFRGLELQAGAQYKDAGLGMGYGFGSQDQFDATRTGFLSATYQHKWNRFSLDTKAALRVNHDRYEWHRGTVSNRHLTHTATLSAAGHYISSIGTSTLGVEWRNENLRSTNLRDTNRMNVHYYAEQTFHRGGWSLSMGVAGNYNTFFGHNISGNADIRYRFRRAGTIFLHADRALRMPTFTDLYYNAGNQLGNPDLKAEKAWTLSLGGDYQHTWQQAGTLSLMADTWFRWGKDIIDWVYTPTDTKRPYHATNQQKVNSVGLELSATYRLNPWLRSVRVDYGFTHLFLNLQETQSRYLDYLSHKLILKVEHGIYRGLGAAWIARYEQREGQYNDAEGQVCNYQPVVLLDGEIFYEYKWVRLELSVSNITNARYYSYGGVLQHGIWPRLSIQVTF
ncbi:MAG: TonB-dependent receptor [Paludibacteraceae bacterium]|nr:TonB-dependent receptor [Paludibacteraceae bacterium]